MRGMARAGSYKEAADLFSVLAQPPRLRMLDEWALFALLLAILIACTLQVGVLADVYAEFMLPGT